MIELNKLGKHYPGTQDKLVVLDSLDLKVKRQERLAIIGPSGSGKTTLLLILTGLEAASSGEISVAGESMSQLTADQRADLRREKIGIVFQSFHLIPSLTAIENVALPLEIAGKSHTRDRAGAILERVGLGSRNTHYPSQLSGGEQQRVAIARALINEPELLVADEPTGNLDNRTGQRIAELLFELNRESGTTLVLVTHDESLAAECDRCLRLQQGRLIDNSTASSS